MIKIIDILKTVTIALIDSPVFFYVFIIYLKTNGKIIEKHHFVVITLFYSV